MSRPKLLQRWLAIVSRGASRGPRYVYLSFHKSATQFTERVLREVCVDAGLRAATFDSRHDSVETHSLARTDFLMLTDYTSGMVDLSALDARGFRVIRDPRDTLVSMYFSHRESHALNHEEIVRNREALADLGVSEGLDYLLEHSRFFARIMRELEVWSPETHGYYETTFERLIGDPFSEFAAVLSALDLHVDPGRLAGILDRNSFAALRTEWAESHPEADVNHYRAGVVGAWRTYLSGAAREKFRTRYGPLLVKLGYEATLDW